MPPRRAKSQVGSAKPAGDQGLVGATFCEEGSWNASLAFVVGNRIEDYGHIGALVAAVKGGTRKLFSCVSREDLFNQVLDLGNMKTPHKGKEVPQFFDICEPCKQHLDNGEEIPLPLLARLIKFKLLDIKSQDMKRREAEKKALEVQDKSSKGKADKKEGSRSPAKGSKSTAGKGKAPEPTLTKAESKLKKRGEEDLDAKYINDEPDDGPQHYVIITGFHHPHLLSQLSEIGVNIDAIINISSQFYDSPAAVAAEDAKTTTPEDAMAAAAGVSEDEEKKRKEREQMSAELKKFWQDVLLLMQRAPESSSLHDVTRLEHMVPNSIVPSDAEDSDAKVAFGATLFEVVACMMYNLLDAKRQWKNYLANLQLIHIPQVLGTMETLETPAVAKSPILSHSQSKMESVIDVETAKHGFSPVEVDMRNYNERMNSIPLESVSIPLIMHCMLEQVCAYDSQAQPDAVQTEKSECLEDSLSQHLNILALKLALTVEERKILFPDYVPPLSTLDEGNQKQPILISYHDDLTRRLNHLQPVDGFDPLEAEREMLGCSQASSILARCPDEPDHRTALERAARFQELLYFCTQQEAVSKSDISHALHQFVLECMNLTTVDEHGRIRRPQMEQDDIPWDDPYPYYVGMIPTVDERVKSGGIERPDSSCKGLESDRDGESDPEGLSRSGSILRRPDSLGSRKRASSCHSVHFEEYDAGHPGDEDLDETKGCSQSSSSDPSQNLSSAHPSSSSLGNVADVFNDCTKRNLDEWQFAEHMEPKVLLQALLRALETHPYVDTYYQKRDNSFLIVMHNPRNPSIAHSFDDWHIALHSNVRFRNYLEYVSGGIVEWTQLEEAKYEASLLAAEVAKLQKEGEETPATPTDKRSRSKSPKKTESRAGKSPVSSVDRSTPCESFVRAGSLKAWKEEQARIKVEEEEQARLAEEKRTKSAQKKHMKETAAEDKKSKEKDKETKKQPDSKSAVNETVEQSNVAVVSTQPEKYWPFTGYDVGDKLIHIAGINSTLFPEDGGQIITERIQYLHGNTSVKATVRKSGHSFTVHVVDPKRSNDNEEENEAVKEDAEECTTESAAGEVADGHNVADRHRLHCDMEMKIAEDNNDRVKDCSNELGQTARTEQSCEPSTAERESPPEKPCIGRFGSFTAQFSDGLVLSVSTFGPSGEPLNGKSYEPEPYIPPPVQIMAATGATTERDVSPSKRSKLSDKTSRDKDKEKHVVTDIVTPAPPESEVKEEVINDVPVYQPFQQLYVTCPDGLTVTYFLESSLGIALSSDEKRLLIRQSYPFKTKCLQKCEGARKTAMREQSRVITSDGTVIKTMIDGTTQVLFADGAVSEFCFSSALLPAPLTVVPDPQQVVKEVISSATKKKASRRGLRSEQTGTATPAEEEMQDKGYWITTLPTGERIANRLNGSPVEVPSAVLYVASDPQTLQVMHTREDHVITIYHPDGLIIVEHSDGTRITTKQQEIEEPLQEDGSQGKEQKPNRTEGNIMAQQEHQNQERTEVGEHEEETEEEQEMNEFYADAADEELRGNEKQPSKTKVAKFVLVECPGYASVKFDSVSGLCSTEFGSGCVVDCMTEGRYDVFHPTGGFLRLDPDGTAVYYEQTDGQQTLSVKHQPQYYVMRHSDNIIAETVDKHGTHYVVTNSGENHVNLLSDIGELPKDDNALLEGMNSMRQPSAEICCSTRNGSSQLKAAEEIHGNHIPRLFAVRSDGSGQELLRSDDVAPYLSSAERDPGSVVLKAPLPDCTDVYGITVLRPLPKNTSQAWLKGYLLDSIIPAGLKSHDLRKASPGEAKTHSSVFSRSSKLGVNSPAVKEEPATVAKRVICPSVLEFRQLIKYNSVSEAMRTRLSSGLKAFADHVKKRVEYYKGLSIQDTRTDEERAVAEELLARLPNPCATPQELKSVDDVKSIYEKALTPVEHPRITASAKMRMKNYDLEKIKQELDEERECRLALRLQNISPYFKSELAAGYYNKQQNKQTLSKQFLGYISCGTPVQSDDVEPRKESIQPSPPGITIRHVSPEPPDASEDVQTTSRDNETCDDNKLSNREIENDTGDSAEKETDKEAFDSNGGPQDGVLATTEHDVVDRLIVTQSSFVDQNMSPKLGDRSEESCVIEAQMKLPEFAQKPVEDDALPAFRMPDIKGILADVMSGKNAEDIEKSITEYSKTPNQKTGKDLNEDSARSRAITDCDKVRQDFQKVPSSAASDSDECGKMLQRPMMLISNCDEDDPLVAALTKQNAWQENGVAKQPDCDDVNVTMEQDRYSAQQVKTNMETSQSDNYKGQSQMWPGSVGSVVTSVGVEPQQSSHHPIPGHIPYGKRPGATPYTKDSVRRKVNNIGITGATPVGYQTMNRLRGMELAPERVDFGILKEGNTYAVNLSLRNTGVDACRFRVKQPPPSTGVKILYKPGPVAAGMKTDIQVEIYAIAAGVEGDRGVGLIAHNVEIATETDQMLLPVKATVLTANEFDCRSPDSPKGGKSPGVKLVSNKAPAGVGLIRTRKHLMHGGSVIVN